MDSYSDYSSQRRLIHSSAGSSYSGSNRLDRSTSRRAAPPPVRDNKENSKGSRELRNRAGGGMAGMLDADRSRTRRERTFVGSECAVCEEPLEHTLRGERILQFSCGHVSHEACFYEYIKEFESQYCPTCNAPLGLDTSRGGNVLDIGKTFGTGALKTQLLLIILLLQRS